MSLQTRVKTDALLPMIHIAFSNLKTWLLGTHHGVSQQHLQAYLNEFVFRCLTVLSNDRIQLYLGNCGTCPGTYLRDTLQRRLGSPDSMIGNKPDRQGIIKQAGWVFSLIQKFEHTKYRHDHANIWRFTIN